jgi:hypothetical protein
MWLQLTLLSDFKPVHLLFTAVQRYSRKNVKFTL